MNIYISLLRGINVSGKNKIKMSDLKTLYESLHFHKVQTYIQSGNVIFANSLNEANVLARQIEQAILKTFSLEVAVLVMEASTFKEIINNNPFKTQDPSKVLVTFLASVPDHSAIESIRAARQPTEEIKQIGQYIYLYCPNGYGHTKLSNAFIERKSGATATTRNWRTVTKLMNIVQDSL